MEEPVLAPGRPQLSQSLPDIMEPPLEALTNVLKIVRKPSVPPVARLYTHVLFRIAYHVFRMQYTYPAHQNGIQPSTWLCTSSSGL